MTVSAQPTIFQYVGNGVTTVFAYNCQVLQPSDLNVYVNGVAVLSGITKGGIGSLTGGTVTFAVAPANGAQVILEREVVLERTTDYQQNGDFLSRVVNPDFNRIWMALQQLLTGVTRSLKFPKSDVAPITELPPAASRANLLLSFDASGNPVTVAPSSQSATALQFLLAGSTGASLIGFLQSGVGAILRTLLSKLFEMDVSPEDFGAVGDGVTDDTAAMNKAFATGRMVNGNGKTYKVVGANIIDTFSGAGVGYGASKAWFSAGLCRDINFIGAVSFGLLANSHFLGKHRKIENVLVTGDARFASWYCKYAGIRVTGTTYMNSDFPPATNFFGFYYNEFHYCDFENVVFDQRYGPINDNGFFYCQFNTCWVKDTGNAGYGGATLPSKDFHLNTFMGCEWFTTVGITAPDGFLYSFVIDDNVNVGGVNRVITGYMEQTVSGFYGRGLEIENIHMSGNATIMGGGQIGYNMPLAGEGGAIARDIPHIYPAANMVVGGDWSILDATGKPYCLTSTGMTETLGTDSQEPTGLSKYVQFAGAAFATVVINFGAADAANRTLRSFAVIYKLTVGSILWETQDAAGSTVFNAVNVTRMANGWALATGHTYGFARMNSAGAYTVRVSAVSAGRGAGLQSPATNQPGGKPLLDLSGGANIIDDFINARGYYRRQNFKTMSAASGNVDFFTVTLPNFSGQSYHIRVNFSVHSGGTGSRQFYRESIIQINGAGTLVETNVHAVAGANATLAFVLGAAGLMTIRTTCAGTAEDAQMAIEILGANMAAARIAVL